MEFGKESRNDLLEYLRSLDSDMASAMLMVAREFVVLCLLLYLLIVHALYMLQVNEISRPSSPEVEEIIQQLVQNVLQMFFKEDTMTKHTVGFHAGDGESCGDGYDESCDRISTPRDYLAKLLFWYVYQPIS